MTINKMREIILACILFTSTFAWGNADSIRAACKRQQPAQTPFAQDLERLQNDFATQEQRVNHPKDLVRRMDEIISKSKFAHDLECRENIKRTHNFSYKQIFQDPALGNLAMQITPLYSRGEDGFLKTDLTLEVNLTKAIQTLLFVYLHELKHLCQAPKTAHLADRLEKAQAAGNTKAVESLSGEIIRDRYFGEVEAFYEMQLAYEDFVESSPRLCHRAGVKEEANDTLADSYVDSALALEQGTFAQTVIAGYIEDGGTQNIRKYLLDENSNSHQYKTPFFGEKYELQSLHPILKAMINRLGIKVSEAP